MARTKAENKAWRAGRIARRTFDREQSAAQKREQKAEIEANWKKYMRQQGTVPVLILKHRDYHAESTTEAQDMYLKNYLDAFPRFMDLPFEVRVQIYGRVPKHLCICRWIKITNIGYPGWVIGHGTIHVHFGQSTTSDLLDPLHCIAATVSSQKKKSINYIRRPSSRKKM